MTLSLSNYLAADSAAQALRRDVRDGLTRTPKSLPPKWFYDSVGSDLFDQITRLPEYYPTRAEAQILRAGRRRSPGVGRRHARRARQRHLGEDPVAAGCVARQRIPAPVHPVRRRRRRAQRRRVGDSARIPGIEIDAVCGDFEEHLGKIPRRPPVGVFLGSTIGNLTPGRGRSCPRCRTRCSPVTVCCWAPTW